MIQKVKELRTHVPIAIYEAMTLLKENGGDVEKCIYLFKAKAIRQICKATGCDKAMAANYLEAEKLDINHTISAIRTVIYDRNYKPQEGVTLEKIVYADQWVNLMDEMPFGDSLRFKHIHEVIDVLSRIMMSSRTAEMIRKAKLAYDEVFEDYSDDMPIEEFVKRHQRLDAYPEFVEADTIIPLKRIVIKEELIKHKRNLLRLASERM